MVLLIVDTQKGIVDERLYAFETFVSNIKDLIRILNWPPLPTGPYQMSLDLFPVTNNEVLLMETLLKRGEQNIDQLHQLTRIPVHDLSVLLLKLELEGHVMQLPGNCYTLI